VVDRVRVLSGGSGAPLLLLLHGLGATAEVWDGWRPHLAERWPGRWLAPDLPGHGGSPPLPRYSFGALAAAVAEIAGDAGDAGDVVVLGHSLGGVVGLALGSGWFGVPVRTVVGLGMKVSWTPEELARARALADRPVQDFATRDEAARRHLRVSGLAGLVAADAPAACAGTATAGGSPWTRGPSASAPRTCRACWPPAGPGSCWLAGRPTRW
jgi:pimeloyl-ACP methyl ester carboxylesterase